MVDKLIPARVRLSKSQTILASSIAEDLAEVESKYAFGEITHAELIDIQAQMHYRLDMVIMGEFPYDN